jgi:hypothetical protein
MIWMTKAFSGVLFNIFSEGITRSNSTPLQVTFLSEGSKEAVSRKWSNASHKFANDSSSETFVILFLHSSRISLQRRSDISISLMTSMRIFSFPILSITAYNVSFMSALTGTAYKLGLLNLSGINTHMARRVATGLLVASLILLIIYGADVAVAASSPQRQGFLPFDEAIRGGVFGGGAVIISIIAFIIARKEYAPTVSSLLFVNGGLIIAGMIVLSIQGSVTSEVSSSTVRTIGSTIAMGALLIGLGGWKLLIDRRIHAARRKEPAQK